jgi:hypothetical protein
MARVAGAVHCGTHSLVPQEFERRVLEWFAEHSRPTPNQAVATN